MSETNKRYAFLDNLRCFVIFLVVVMHSNVTYSGLGGWYYKEVKAESLDHLSLILFGLYGSFTQAWFMGALFMVGGFLAARSLSRRGSKHFARERLFRLGSPLLVYMLVLNPLVLLVVRLHQGNVGLADIARLYAAYIVGGSFIGGTGPLWFAEALLIFSLIYALVRLVRPRDPVAQKRAVPSIPALMGLILMTGAVAFFVRLVFPVGSDVLNLQLGYFASYLTLFTLGIHAGEKDWLQDLPGVGGVRWFYWTLALGLLSWFVLMLTGGALAGDLPINGGWYWQSAAYAFWEAAVAIGFSLGIIAFFQRFVNQGGPIARFLSANSFGVFMFHSLVLTSISVLLADWSPPSLLKHFVVAPTSWIATLLLSEFVLRRIPGLRTIIK